MLTKVKVKTAEDVKRTLAACEIVGITQDSMQSVAGEIHLGLKYRYVEQLIELGEYKSKLTKEEIAAWEKRDDERKKNEAAKQAAKDAKAKALAK